MRKSASRFPYRSPIFRCSAAAVTLRASSVRSCRSAVFRSTPKLSTHHRASFWAAGVVLGRCVECDKVFTGEAFGGDGDHRGQVIQRVDGIAEHAGSRPSLIGMESRKG